jgi:hypothetical protein
MKAADPLETHGILIFVQPVRIVHLQNSRQSRQQYFHVFLETKSHDRVRFMTILLVVRVVAPIQVGSTNQNRLNYFGR